MAEHATEPTCCIFSNLLRKGLCHQRQDNRLVASPGCVHWRLKQGFRPHPLEQIEHVCLAILEANARPPADDDDIGLLDRPPNNFAIVPSDFALATLKPGHLELRELIHNSQAPDAFELTETLQEDHLLTVLQAAVWLEALSAGYAAESPVHAE